MLPKRPLTLVMLLVSIPTQASLRCGPAGGPYQTRWQEFLKKVSPDAKHTLKNPAFGGSTSGQGASAAGRDRAMIVVAAAAERQEHDVTLLAAKLGSLNLPCWPPSGAGIFTVCVNDMVQEDADLVVIGGGAGVEACVAGSGLGYTAIRGWHPRGGGNRLGIASCMCLGPCCRVQHQRRPRHGGKLQGAAAPGHGAHGPQAADAQKQARGKPFCTCFCLPLKLDVGCRASASRVLQIARRLPTFCLRGPRSCLQYPCRPAVIFLNHYAWFVAGGGGEKIANYVANAENDFNVIGAWRACRQKKCLWLHLFHTSRCATLSLRCLLPACRPCLTRCRPPSPVPQASTMACHRCPSALQHTI